MILCKNYSDFNTKYYYDMLIRTKCKETPPFLLASTILLSVSMNPTTLGTSYKWNQTIFVIFLSGYCFPQWLHHFTFPPAAHKGSSFSTSSLTLVILCFFWVLKVATLMGVKWSLLMVLISLAKLLFVGGKS